VADTTEVAAWFGDDIAYRRDSFGVDPTGLPLLGFVLRHAGAGSPVLHRLRLGANLVVTGGAAIQRGLMSQCVTTAQMADRLGLNRMVCDSLRQVFTRWDGKGLPAGTAGDEIALTVRLFHLADAVEVIARLQGSTPRSSSLARGVAISSIRRLPTCRSGGCRHVLQSSTGGARQPRGGERLEQPDRERTRPAATAK
jgi:hypothetical protein